jgi:hypothetical protein
LILTATASKLFQNPTATYKFESKETRAHVYCVGGSRVGYSPTQYLRLSERCEVLGASCWVRLFKKDALYKRTPVASRRWEPSADLARTAEEISKYINENGPVEATLVAADEV